jgi:transposase-like protein
MKGEARAGYWRQHVEAQRSSGESVLAYCRRMGVSQWSFYEWRRRLQQREPEAVTPVRWLPVTVAPEVKAEPAEVSGCGIAVYLPSGVALKLSRDFDAGALRRAVGALL